MLDRRCNGLKTGLRNTGGRGYLPAMADTLTLHIDEETADRLRRAAEQAGESVESAARRLLGEALAEQDSPVDYQLSEEQLADLDERLKNPGPYATDAEVEAFFARFRR